MRYSGSHVEGHKGQHNLFAATEAARGTVVAVVTAFVMVQGVALVVPMAGRSPRVAPVLGPGEQPHMVALVVGMCRA